MVETVLALPIVLFFVVAIICFGLATKRFSPLQNAARYDCWRQTTPGACGPGSVPGTAGQDLASAFYPKDSPTPNQVSRNYDTSIPTAIDQPLTNALSGQAQTTSLGNQVMDHFPKGVSSECRVTHSSTMPLFSRLGLGSEVSRHAFRLDGDWKFADGIRYLGTPSAAYTDGWHPIMRNPNDTGGTWLSGIIQGLFLSELSGLPNGVGTIYATPTGYRGPNWAMDAP